MNNREAHFYLEELQRMMTQHRGIFSEEFVCANGMAIQALEQERKKGNWIIKENPGTEWYRVTCSACGEDVSSVIPTIGFFPNVKALWDFCPNCGARMEEEDGNQS